MKTRSFEQQTSINQPPRSVFNFFSSAENLQKLTPASFGLIIETPLPILMKKGTIIDYKMKVIGITFKWKTEITFWNPPVGFEDTQLKGPYKKWVHSHYFEEKNGQTIMHDKIIYCSKGWLLEPLINSLFVKRTMRRLFEYRQKNIEKIFNRQN